jgi:hypothetical protein
MVERGVFLLQNIRAGLCDVPASSTLSITVIFFNGDGLRGDEKMPVISSIPLASRGLCSSATPVRLCWISLALHAVRSKSHLPSFPTAE